MTEISIETLYSAGTHFGFVRGRRHPSATPFIYITKDRSDIFNLDQTTARLEAACAYANSVAASGRQVLFVGGKHEASGIVKAAAERAGLPYVAGRWIGGTLTNFKNIRKRIDRLEKLMSERETGELDKYTKKERLLIDREIEELLGRFGGLIKMADLPAALFVIDTRHEDTSVREANQLGIPVIGLANSDCDFSLVQYPIPGNDTSIKSIRLVADMISQSYSDGKAAMKPAADKHVPAKAVENRAHRV